MTQITQIWRAGCGLFKRADEWKPNFPDTWGAGANQPSMFGNSGGGSLSYSSSNNKPPPVAPGTRSIFGEMDAAANRAETSFRNWKYSDGHLPAAMRAWDRGEVGTAANEGGQAAVGAIPQPVKDTIHGAAQHVGDAAARVPKAVLGAGNAALGTVGAVGAQIPRAATYPLQMYAKSQGQESPTYNAVKGYGDSMGRSALSGVKDLGGALNPMESGYQSRVMGSHQQDMQGAPKFLQNTAHVADIVGGEAGSAALTGGLGKVTKGLTAAAPAVEGATEAATVVPRAQRAMQLGAHAYNYANKGEHLLGTADKTLSSMESGDTTGLLQNQVQKRVTGVKLPGASNPLLDKAKDLYSGGKKLYGIGSHAVAHAEEPVTPPPTGAPTTPAQGATGAPPPIAQGIPKIPSLPKVAGDLYKAGAALLIRR